MDKIVLGERPIKEIVLPKSKVKVKIFASLLISDLGGVDLKTVNNAGISLVVLAKLIKEWNLYGSDKDEKPLEINKENIGRLPLDDIVFLVNELTVFETEEKKS